MRSARAPIACALLVAVSVVLTLAAAETLLRVGEGLDRNHLENWVEPPLVVEDREVAMGELIRRHPDDRIVYELRPGTRACYLGQEVRINSLGMRDDEVSPHKPPGRFRILALGDSHLFGWGVGQDESFAQVLERELEARAPGRFEVLNTGVPGYNTVMEARTFELRADELEPDLVLVHYVGNDMELPNFLSEPVDPWSLDRSFLLELVRARLRVLAGTHRLPRGLLHAERDPRHSRFWIPEDRIPERYRPLQGWDHMEQAFLRIAELAKARHVPLALLVHGADFRDRLAGRSDTVLPPSVREIAARRAAEGWLVIDPEERTLAYLRAHGLSSEALWIRPDDQHMSALYHRLAAEEILAAFERAGLVSVPAGPAASAGTPPRPARSRCGS